jgi:hypothetical protein
LCCHQASCRWVVVVLETPQTPMSLTWDRFFEDFVRQEERRAEEK